MPQVVAAMDRVRAGVQIARATLQAGNQFISEHPAEEGANSVLKSRDLTKHSGMHSTSPFARLIKDFGLLTVLTDLACSGHAHKKVTEYLVSPLLHASFQRTFGLLRVEQSSARGTATRTSVNSAPLERAAAARSIAAIFIEVRVV